MMAVTRSTTPRVVVPAIVGVILLAGGCARPAGPVVESTNPPTSTNSTATGSAVDVSILEAGGSGNYVVFGTPEDLVERSSVALVGRIDGFEDGPTLFYPPDEREHSVVIRVRIDKLYKSEGVSLADGYAYVSIRRGGEVVDADGNPVKGSGEGITVAPVSTFADALPKGTRVSVIANPVALPQDGVTKVIDESAGHPSGSTLLGGNHPQTFSVEPSKGEAISGWPRLTMKAMTAHLSAPD